MNNSKYALISVSDKSNLKDLCLFLFDKNYTIISTGGTYSKIKELCGSDNLKKILNDLKSSYDYIIIDSAPLMLVSDTYELIKYSDIVVYTLRSGHTDRKIIPFINSLIEDKKVDNVGFVLNGIKLGPKSYYKYGYSYRYSYQYKYNYGYGYGYLAMTRTLLIYYKTI